MYHKYSMWRFEKFKWKHQENDTITKHSLHEITKEGEMKNKLTKNAIYETTDPQTGGKEGTHESHYT